MTFHGEETMRTLSKLAMRTLSKLATLILSFNFLPIRVAMVESQWLTGRSFGQQPGGDIDSDIDSFAHRDSGSTPTKDA
jgi:hypothetical protein